MGAENQRCQSNGERDSGGGENERQQRPAARAKDVRRRHDNLLGSMVST